MKTKRFLLLAGSVFLSLSAPAQTLSEGLNYARIDYVGTARTLAMGNAFTALGGDLGSIVLNPAGSATAGFSQFSITPGFDLSVSRSQGTLSPGQSTPELFATASNANQAAFMVPNGGFMLNFRTNSSVLQGVSIGLVSSMTHSFNNRATAYESANTVSSWLRSVAQSATDRRIDYREMDKGYDWAFPFDVFLGYKTDMISTIRDQVDRYAAVTEVVEEDGSGGYRTKPRPDGSLSQAWSREVTGSRNDWIINLGFNFLNKVFFGANLGIVSLSMRYNDAIKEAAVDPSKYVTHFVIDGTDYYPQWREAKYDYNLNASGVGVYGKFGILVVPVEYLRVGLTWQTPMTLKISERFGATAVNTFNDRLFGGTSSLSDYRNEFRLWTPSRFSVGLAGVILKRIVISGDYEVCNYGRMSFKAQNSLYDNEWAALNQEVKTGASFSHNFRLGIEGRLTDLFALRAGANLLTTPEVYTDENNGHSTRHPMNWFKHGWKTFSFGAGYTGTGSFFADLAVAAKIAPTEYFYPYADLHNASGGVAVPAPEIAIKNTLWTFLLTVGWRF
ncbi:MAG: hypothetical protein J6Y32_04720 [Bacteroidales bacterium]|nr:hypothetical protein [Bacteroidales bacterium]